MCPVFKIEAAEDNSGLSEKMKKFAEIGGWSGTIKYSAGLEETREGNGWTFKISEKADYQIVLDTRKVYEGMVVWTGRVVKVTASVDSSLHMPQFVTLGDIFQGFDKKKVEMKPRTATVKGDKVILDNFRNREIPVELTVFPETGMYSLHFSPVSVQAQIIRPDGEIPDRDNKEDKEYTISTESIDDRSPAGSLDSAHISDSISGSISVNDPLMTACPSTLEVSLSPSAEKLDTYKVELRLEKDVIPESDTVKGHTPVTQWLCVWPNRKKPNEVMIHGNYRIRPLKNGRITKDRVERYMRSWGYHPDEKSPDKRYVDSRGFVVDGPSPSPDKKRQLLVDPPGARLVIRPKGVCYEILEFVIGFSEDIEGTAAYIAFIFEMRPDKFRVKAFGPYEVSAEDWSRIRDPQLRPQLEKQTVPAATEQELSKPKRDSKYQDYKDIVAKLPEEQ